MSCALQILNAASLMARTNFKNHVATNFFSRTLHWIRLHLQQHIYFVDLECKLVRSWAKFVCRAATEGIDNIWDLLPRYTSLAQPPAATRDYLKYLVATIQSSIGPLPVTEVQGWYIWAAGPRCCQCLLSLLGTQTWPRTSQAYTPDLQSRCVVEDAA